MGTAFLRRRRRQEHHYLTIELLDPIDLKLDLQPEHLTLDAKSNDAQTTYHLKLDFFKEVDPDLSKINTENGSHIFIVLRKKEKAEEYWPRLTKEKLKYHYIKTDFDKWVDEDEQDEAADDENEGSLEMLSSMGAGGAGGAGMGGLGGLGGAGGADLSALAAQLGQVGDLQGANAASGGDDEGEEGEGEEEGDDAAATETK
ncbi:Protein wos2 [Candida viswanathii]|uniref:Protein wos2 n=1 Tax=Candida viswanathii TaxID=5486 RepID=A0A367XWE4_9ASCO|nr:Protein wos2 [Candida viswanathii]